MGGEIRCCSGGGRDSSASADSLTCAGHELWPGLAQIPQPAFIPRCTVKTVTPAGAVYSAQVKKLATPGAAAQLPGNRPMYLPILPRP